MELFDAIYGRRSVRQYSQRSLAEETIIALVRAAALAPSAMNHQPWSFIVTQDRETIDTLAEGRRYAGLLQEVPCAVIVCADCSFTPRKRPGGAGVDHFSIQDTAAAVQNLLLAAYGLGVASCWVGDFSEQMLMELFRIPYPHIPVAVIGLGITDAPPPTPERKPLTEILHWERFQQEKTPAVNSAEQQQQRRADYAALASDLQALLGQAEDEQPLTLLANTAALLWERLPAVNWLGFYLTRADRLELGPFQGRPACTRIPFGRGVCGQAAQQQQTLVVPDVHEFPDHIACDPASRSEIVVPLQTPAGALGVLDIDSPFPGRFDSIDQQGLEQCVAALMASIRGRALWSAGRD